MGGGKAWEWVAPWWGPSPRPATSKAPRCWSQAPRLITKETVAGMKPGSVIVDIAPGNCELTEPGKTVVKHGVTIAGPVNLPATMPVHASQLYAKNITELLKLLVKDGKLKLDFTDEIIKGACLVKPAATVAG